MASCTWKQSLCCGTVVIISKDSTISAHAMVISVIESKSPLYCSLFSHNGIHLVFFSSSILIFVSFSISLFMTRIGCFPIFFFCLMRKVICYLVAKEKNIYNQLSMYSRYTFAFSYRGSGGD